MEITIVGWHTVDAPYHCEDCGSHADFVVVRKDDEGYEDPRNLCRDCSKSERYTLVEDRIENVFRNLGM